MLAVVDGQRARGEDAGIGHGRAAVGRPGVADGRADAREQLFGAEGLRQIIVRARVQRGDLIALVAARGDDDDGKLRPLAHRLDYLHPVHVRQAEVEHDEIRTVRAYHGERLTAGARDDNVVSVGAENGADEAGNAFFILYYKYLIPDIHNPVLPMAE